MKLPFRARIYLYGISAVAIAVLAASAAWLVAFGGAEPAAEHPELWLVFAQLVALSVVAQHFPLAFGPKRKHDLSQTVHLTILLLSSTPLAAILTGLAEGIGQTTYLARRDAQGRRRGGPNGILFNTAQAIIGTAVAGAARSAAGPLTAGATVPTLGIEPQALAGVLAAGTALYLFNSCAVAVMIALHSGRNPFHVWRDGRLWNALHSAGLLPLGAFTAHVAEQNPWVPLAMALPAVLTYVSMRRTAEAEAAVRLRDEFLGVAAHELRTPLTSLRGYAQLLISQFDRGSEVDPAKLARSLRTIDRQSAKLSELIDQLLDLSRLQSRSLALDRGGFDLTELAREVAAGLQPLTPGYTLVVQAPRPVPIVADRLRVEQVLVNLINNAARHAGVGERIDVEVAGPTRDGGSATLAVRDYGVGIPQEHRDRVFERFYQIGPEAKAGGLGLGLYITRQIVELHGGRVHAECPPDGGTRFVVSLPAPVMERVPAAVPAAAAA